MREIEVVPVTTIHRFLFGFVAMVLIAFSVVLGLATGVMGYYAVQAWPQWYFVVSAIIGLFFILLAGVSFVGAMLLLTELSKSRKAKK